MGSLELAIIDLQTWRSSATKQLEALQKRITELENQRNGKLKKEVKVSLQKFTDSKRNQIQNAPKNKRKDLYKALVNEFVADNDVQGPQQTAQVHSKLKRRTQNPPVNFIVYISFHINPLIFIIIISTRLLNFMDQMR